MGDFGNKEAAFKTFPWQAEPVNLNPVILIPLAGSFGRIFQEGNMLIGVILI